MLALDYDGERVTFDVQGETAWGEPGVLLDRDDDLLVQPQIGPRISTIFW